MAVANQRATQMQNNALEANAQNVKLQTRMLAMEFAHAHQLETLRGRIQELEKEVGTSQQQQKQEPK